MARVIEQNKQRTYLMLAGLVVTALVSLIILLMATGIFSSATVPINPFATCLFAVVMLSSSYFIYRTTQKLQDSSPGLIINNEGITYNLSPIAKVIGQISWADIKQLKENQEIVISVIVKNPETYINRMKHGSMRKQVQKLALHKQPGTLLFISANGLDCDYDELSHWLKSEFEKYKRNNGF